MRPLSSRSLKCLVQLKLKLLSEVGKIAVLKILLAVNIINLITFQLSCTLVILSMY